MFLSEACLLLVILWTAVQYTSPIKCYVGYGQRGLKYSNEIKWIRNCPQSNYCFEAVAFDIEKVRKLINYPWVTNNIVLYISFESINFIFFYSKLI